MATVASIVTNLRANTGQFEAAFQRGEKIIHRFQMRTQQAHAALAGLAAREQSSPAIQAGQSNKALGLSGIAGLAKGGGALLGINVAAGAVQKVAEQTEVLATAFHRGELSGTQAFEHITSSALKAVPVLSSIHAAGESIFDMLDALKNGESFKKQAADAIAFQSALSGVAETAMTIQRNLRDVTGKTPKNQILDQYQDTYKRLLANRNSSVDMNPANRLQIDRAFDAATKAAARLRDTQLERQSAKESDWNPVAGIADAARNKFGNARRAVENAITNRLFDYDKGIEAATARWADRASTFGNTFTHFFEGLQRRKAAFDKAQEAARSRREEFVGGAMGVYERLKAQQDQPVQFAGAAILGSQEEYAMRQRSLFGGQVARRDEKELAKEAVQLHKRELDELKTITDLLRENATQVVDFG